MERNDPVELVRFLFNTDIPSFRKEAETALKTFISGEIINAVLEVSVECMEKNGKFPEDAIKIVTELPNISIDRIVAALSIPKKGRIAVPMLIKLAYSAKSKKIQKQSQRALKAAAKYSSPTVRMALAQALGYSVNPIRGKSLVLKLAKDNDPDIRKAACLVLNAISWKWAIRKLILMQSDNNPDVRQTAIKNLEPKYSKDGEDVNRIRLKGLEKALKIESEEIRKDVVIILTNLAEKWYVMSNEFERLFTLMTEDKSELIVIQALRGLSLTNTIGAVTKLLSIAKTSSKYRKEAVFNLVFHVAPALSGKMILEALETEIDELTIEVIHALKEALTKDMEKMFDIIKEDQRKRVFLDLEEALKIESEEVRNDVERLFTLMTEDKSELIVIQALRGLRLTKTIGAMTKLLSIAKTSSKYRKEAVFNLVFHVAPALSGKMILEALETEIDELTIEVIHTLKEAVTKQNIFHFSKADWQIRAFIDLEEALKIESEEVRNDVVIILTNLVDKWYVMSNGFERLFTLMTEDKSELIVIQALRGLRLTKTIGAVTKLLSIAKTSSKYRKEAVFNLVFHVAPELSGKMIFEALETEIDELTIEVIHALKEALTKDIEKMFDIFDIIKEDQEKKVFINLEEALKIESEEVRNNIVIILTYLAEKWYVMSNEFERLFTLMTEDKSELIVIQALRGLSLTKTIGAVTKLLSIAKTSSKYRKEAVFNLVFHVAPELSGKMILEALETEIDELTIEVIHAIKESVTDRRTRDFIAYFTKSGEITGEILPRILDILSKITSLKNSILSDEAESALVLINGYLEKQKQYRKGRSMGGFANPFDHDSIFLEKEKNNEVDKLIPGSKSNTQSVKFLAIHPTIMKEDEMSSLLTYIFLENFESLIKKDAQDRLSGRKSSYASGSGKSETAIQRGTEITIFPKMSGIDFNPRSIKIEWVDDWHVAEFRMKVNKENLNNRNPIIGSVEFWVEPVCIGQAPIWVAITNESLTDYNIPADSIVNMFQAVFPSYAHEDSRFIERLEKAYSLLNFQYYRDISTLRAGEEWEPRIKELIKKADIFQLCWSKAAALSEYVSKEYNFALQLNRPGFVKPIYWEMPMPAVPDVLRYIHFQQWEM